MRKNHTVKTLDQATAHHQEIAQLKLAILETSAGIIRMETALQAMRRKQTARVRELAIRQTLARHSATP